ncbi:sh3 domain-containing [Holotrichia oblita]|uniref:Sh3 domain-containing n=1 Tax=Holotrichia oblita TaxID=644536 RepID=A0ACB9TEK2_HOLOL|nr:sh3 domain-containing [Holotrichia oblita]
MLEIRLLEMCYLKLGTRNRVEPGTTRNQVLPETGTVVNNIEYPISGAMKKFCHKITKQQWRVSVPNINTSLFKKTFSRNDSEKNDLNVREIKTSSSGTYDLQEAEKNYRTTSSVPNSMFNSDSSDTESDEKFEDACTVLNKSNSNVNDELNNMVFDTNLYVDLESNDIINQNMNNSTGKYESEVPTISFSFFDAEQDGDQYETVNVKKHKSSITIELSNPVDLTSDKSLSLDTLLNDRCSTPTEETSHSTEVFSTPKSTMTDEYSVPIKMSCHEENTILIKETKHIELYMTKNLEELSFNMKCGSDPNVCLRSIDEEEDDGLYKVPRPLQRNRISLSLNDCSLDMVPLSTGSIEGSIEHISCSQVLLEKSKIENGAFSVPCNTENLDYCYTRDKLPAKLRRITLLRKPKNKAVDTWTNLKLRVNNLSHISDKEKITNNIEGMYKSSKNKCKKVLKQTGMMFKSKKDQENVDPNKSYSPHMTKNEAFFANIKRSDDLFADNKVESVCGDSEQSTNCDRLKVVTPSSVENDKKEDYDFTSIKNAFRKSKFFQTEGQNGFDDLRRYVKQGGDFCKELATILHERSSVISLLDQEAFLSFCNKYSDDTLSSRTSIENVIPSAHDNAGRRNKAKLKSKKWACRDGVGGLNDAWRAVASEMESRAETHKLLGASILEDSAKPLRTLSENQHRARKQAESAVDKAARSLGDWRTSEAKSKKHSHTCARENEKLQDAMLENRLSRSASLIQLAHIHKSSSDKENAKLEGKKRKAEDAVKKADIEYYTLCVRAERARLEWESAVAKGASTFQSLEEERLQNLKSVLLSYLNHSNDTGPKHVEATERLRGPFDKSDPSQDLATFVTLRQSSQQISEQLLPDFYCEHITLAMNRERRKQALIKLSHLVKQDIDREKKSKHGLENLSRAIKQTPNFGAEDSNQTVAEKLYHMKSMLTYLEGARFKVQNALAELDSRPKTGHPLAPHITITRDKSGLQQSVLKVPLWLKEQWGEPEQSPVSEKSLKSNKSDNFADHSDPDWNDRGTADGNSNQPDSDFDEFSSQGSSAGGLCTDDSPVQPIARCKALYAYTPNLSDELALHPGDILSVYRQQDDGWWLGECNGSVGIFPATYVETLPANVIKC